MQQQFCGSQYPKSLESRQHDRSRQADHSDSRRQLNSPSNLPCRSTLHPPSLSLSTPRFSTLSTVYTYAKPPWGCLRTRAADRSRVGENRLNRKIWHSATVVVAPIRPHPSFPAEPNSFVFCSPLPHALCCGALSQREPNQGSGASYSSHSR